jgi:hypothetical protein
MSRQKTAKKYNVSLQDRQNQKGHGRGRRVDIIVRMYSRATFVVVVVYLLFRGPSTTVFFLAACHAIAVLMLATISKEDEGNPMVVSSPSRSVCNGNDDIS